MELINTHIMKKFTPTPMSALSAIMKFNLLPTFYMEELRKYRKVDVQDVKSRIAEESQMSMAKIDERFDRIQESTFFEDERGDLLMLSVDGFLDRFTWSTGIHAGGFVPFSVYEDEEHIYLRRATHIVPKGKEVAKNDAGRRIMKKSNHLAWSDCLR